MPNKIVMVGFFLEAYELALASGFEVIGCIDRKCNLGDGIVPWLGDDDMLPSLVHHLANAKLLITPDAPAARRRLHELYASHGMTFASLVSPDARISRSATLGEGAFVQCWVHVSSGVRIGRFVRVNVGANLMHDAVVGDYSTIAPNACILGRVRIGSASYIGANATVLPGLSVGDGAVVGAGSVVTKDVPDGTVVAGNPARLIPRKG